MHEREGRQITCSEDFALKLVQAIVTGRETDNVIQQLEMKMAKLTEVQAKQQEAIAATQAAVARVVEDNTAQNVEIQKLKDQIAAGGTVTEADLDSLLAGNQTIIDTMNALDPIPATPPTE